MIEIGHPVEFCNAVAIEIDVSLVEAHLKSSTSDIFPVWTEFAKDLYS
jgi:hypothetical protein